MLTPDRFKGLRPQLPIGFVCLQIARKILGGDFDEADEVWQAALEG